MLKPLLDRVVVKMIESEETTKRVNCYENGNLPLFRIEKDTRGGVLYAPFACVLMVRVRGFEPPLPCEN